MGPSAHDGWGSLTDLMESPGEGTQNSPLLSSHLISRAMFFFSNLLNFLLFGPSLKAARKAPEIHAIPWVVWAFLLLSDEIDINAPLFPAPPIPGDVQGGVAYPTSAMVMTCNCIKLGSYELPKSLTSSFFLFD